MIRGRELELEHPKNLENDSDKPAVSDKTCSYECCSLASLSSISSLSSIPYVPVLEKLSLINETYRDLPISLCIAGLYF